MTAAVSLARVLPIPGGPGVRLALFASLGGAAYAGAAWLVDRRAVVAVSDFVLSVARRRAARLAET
jgi:hypothetical protein